MKAEFVAYATQALQHVREDYKEFVKLSLVYLDDVDGGEMTFQRPGALHKARWMAKLLYSLKLHSWRRTSVSCHQAQSLLASRCQTSEHS